MDSDRLAEVKRHKAEDPQAHAEARAYRRQRIEEMNYEKQVLLLRLEREHAAEEQRRAQEAHAARRAQEAQEAQAARRAQEAQRVKEQEAQRAQRAREAQCAQDLEDAKELAEIQEYEALTRALAQSAVPVAARRVVASVAPASATLLQSAVESARQALLYADKVRRDIFLEEREQKLLQLALNHERRMRAECERMDRGVTVAPIEYIIGQLHRSNGSFGNGHVTLYRVMLGNCNLTFSYISAPCGGNQGITGEVWQRQNRGCVVPWMHYNRSGEPEVDLDFQDNVYILPHFREEIATHLEHHSMIHSAHYTKCWYIGDQQPHGVNKTDPTFEVMLTFLARMKKLNRLEFATISSAL